MQGTNTLIHRKTTSQSSASGTFVMNPLATVPNQGTRATNALPLKSNIQPGALSTQPLAPQALSTSPPQTALHNIHKPKQYISWPNKEKLSFEPRLRLKGMYLRLALAKLLGSIGPALYALGTSQNISTNSGRIALSSASIASVIVGFGLEAWNQTDMRKKEDKTHDIFEEEVLEFLKDTVSLCTDPERKEILKKIAVPYFVDLISEANWLAKYISGEESQLVNSGFSGLFGGIGGVFTYMATGKPSGWDAMPLVACIGLGLGCLFTYRIIRIREDLQLARTFEFKDIIKNSVTKATNSTLDLSDFKAFRVQQFRYNPSLKKTVESTYFRSLKTVAPIIPFALSFVDHSIKNSKNLFEVEGQKSSNTFNFLALSLAMTTVATNYLQYFEIQSKTPFYDWDIRKMRESLTDIKQSIENEIGFAERDKLRIDFLELEIRNLQARIPIP